MVVEHEQIVSPEYIEFMAEIHSKLSENNPLILASGTETLVFQATVTIDEPRVFVSRSIEEDFHGSRGVLFEHFLLLDDRVQRYDAGFSSNLLMRKEAHQGVTPESSRFKARYSEDSTKQSWLRTARDEEAEIETHIMGLYKRLSNLPAPA